MKEKQTIETIAADVAEIADIPLEKALTAVETVVWMLRDAWVRNENVTIYCFGWFGPSWFSSTKKRTFKPSKTLLKMVNENYMGPPELIYRTRPHKKVRDQQKELKRRYDVIGRRKWEED